MFTYTTETLNGTKYYTTTNARGTTTMIEESHGTVFVWVNKSAPKALQNIKKQSKQVQNLLAVMEADKAEEAAAAEKEAVQAAKAEIEDFNEWLMDAEFPEEGTTIKTYVEEIAAEDDGCFPEKLKDKDYLKSTILLTWIDWVDAGYEIPSNVAKILLAEGGHPVSSYTNELRMFAAA